MIDDEENFQTLNIQKRKITEEEFEEAELTCLYEHWLTFTNAKKHDLINFKSLTAARQSHYAI